MGQPQPEMTSHMTVVDGSGKDHRLRITTSAPISNDNLASIEVSSKTLTSTSGGNNDNSKDGQDGSGFIAVKRKNVVSIFVGNIDPDVRDGDIYDYMLSKSVTPTNITMYYGRYGSSARVNVHYTDLDTVLSPDFWPEEISFRKWVNRATWESTYAKQRYNKPNYYRYNNNAQNYTQNDTGTRRNRSYSRHTYARRDDMYARNNETYRDRCGWGSRNDEDDWNVDNEAQTWVNSA